MPTDNTPQERREEIARRQWHDLKCIPPFFDDVASGAKPFEVRKNDRDYQKGDGLRLREWTATDGYSGRVVERFVTYVLRDAYAFGVQPGYVVLGLALPAVPTSDEAVKKALGLAVAALQTIQGMEPITHEITLPTVMAQHAVDALNEIRSDAGPLLRAAADSGAPLDFEAQLAERLADPEWVAKWNAVEDDGMSFERLLNAMRSEEGDTVTLLADNPDFNGQPNNAIECCGSWTDWREVRFTGDTLRGALLAAYRSRFPAGSQPVSRAEGAAGNAGLDEPSLGGQEARACEMNDPSARAALNVAASDLSFEMKLPSNQDNTDAG